MIKSLNSLGSSHLMSIVCLATIFCYLAASGCDAYRFNHLHTPANQKVAEAAEHGFEAFRSDTGGILPKKLANISAQSTLRRTVADEVIRFNDLANLHTVGDITWEGIREAIHNNLGINRSPAYLKYTAGIDMMRLLHFVNENHAQNQNAPEVSQALALAFLRFKLAQKPLLNNPQISSAETKLRAKIDDFLRVQKVASLSTAVAPIGPRAMASSLNLEQVLAPLDLGPNPVVRDEFLRRVGKELSKTKAGDAKSLGQKYLTPDEKTVLDLADEARMHVTIDEDAADALFLDRLGKLAAVLKTYEVLIKGERARALIYRNAQSKFVEQMKNLEEELKKPAPTLKPDDPVAKAAAKAEDEESERVLKLLFDFRRGITGIYAGKEKQAELRNDANELKRRLLESVKESRDPASVYALVPLVCSGLDKASLDELQSYIDSLKEMTDALDEGKDPPGKPKAGNAAGEEAHSMQSLVSNKPEDEKALAIKEFHDVYKELKALLKALSGDDGGIDIDMDKAIVAITKTAALLELDLDTKKLSDRLKKLEEAAPVLENLLKLAQGNNGEQKKAQAYLFEFLLTTLARENGTTVKKFDDLLQHKYSGDKTIEQGLRDILTSIQGQEAAASLRLLNFLKELNGLHQQLHEENVRHFFSLNSVAKREVERWQTLRGINQEMFALYDEVRENKAATEEIDRHRPMLFAGEDTIAAWYDSGGTPNKSGIYFPGEPLPAVDQVKRHPAMQVDDDVIGSIRKLAETAIAHQTDTARASNNRVHGRHAADRLRRAIQIVQGFQLISGFNRRAAAENQIFLIAEVQEHDIRLDHVVIASVEQELKLGISELVAFHSTGITDDDIRLVASVVQNGLLTWIGLEVDK